jgi:prepilin peptidase CpaA
MEFKIIMIAVWILTLIAAAVSDLRSFRIPNYLPGILISLFGIKTAIVGTDASLWENLSHFLVVLIIGMGLFSKSWIGGGDAKLYAAVALWFNWAGAATLVFTTTIAGLLLAISFIAARMLGLRKNVPKDDRRIPYGLAIAAGGILNAAWQGWGRLFTALN